MLNKQFLVISLIGMATSPAGATVPTILSGTLTGDNSVFAYISTNDNQLGTPLGSANDWQAPFSISTALTPGVTNYLHVEIVNWGAWGGLLGSFSLSNNAFAFANGAQNLMTDTTHWSGNYDNANFAVTPQPWITPAGGLVTFFPNGGGVWGSLHGGPFATIAANSQWIWPSAPLAYSGFMDATSYGACQYCTVEFSTKITAAVPESETWAMMLAGLGMMGLAVRRSKTA